MTTENKCPECGNEWLHTVWAAGDFHWKYCNSCGWDERRQLREKIREEMANKPGP